MVVQRLKYLHPRSHVNAAVKKINVISQNLLQKNPCDKNSVRFRPGQQETSTP